MSFFDLIRAKNSPGVLATLAILALAKPRNEKTEVKPGSRCLWLIAFPDLPPTVETVETPEKASIDSLDSTPRGPFQKIECTASLGGAELDAQVEPHRLWDITEQGGVCWRSSFCPHKTREEVLAWHPGALSVEPYQPTPPPPGGPLSAGDQPNAGGGGICPSLT